ncbi:MAG: sensor histidine kinase [Limisphaerales bacterium]
MQCSDDGHDFLLTVSDRGPGLPAEPVAKGASSLPRMTGLGLPIARRLTELHGGKVLLSSEPGKGTTARVSLPVHSPEAPAATEQT